MTSPDALMPPFISIVMPVRNEALHIKSVLERLVSQEYPSDRFEILVADGNSTDDTAIIVKEFAATTKVSIQIVPNPRQLSSAGRNAGVLASRGDIVAFVDGHCQIPSTRLLADIVELMNNQQADCLCRPQPLHVPGNTTFQQVLANTRATIIGHGSDSTIFDMDKERFVNPSSSGAIYRSSVFERIGMYDESFDACEDVEFNFRVWKAGIRAYSSPRVAVFYSPRASLSALWRQVMRYGQGRFRLMLKHSDAITLAQLVPAGYIAWLIALAALSFSSPLAAKILLLTVLIYFLVIGSFAILLAFRYGWKHLGISPLVYLAIHLGLGSGFWKQALLGWARRPQQECMPPFERKPDRLKDGSTTDRQYVADMEPSSLNKR